MDGTVLRDYCSHCEMYGGTVQLIVNKKKRIDNLVNEFKRKDHREPLLADDSQLVKYKARLTDDLFV